MKSRRAIAGLVQSGDVEVVVDKTYSLGDAGRAVARMLRHRARGCYHGVAAPADGAR